jgi:4-hydroxy-tetrahydrodipicolinate synthase
MSQKQRFEGVMPAIITPFTEDGHYDSNGYRKNLEFLLRTGISGVVVNGSTGEASALTEEERVDNIKIASEVARQSRRKVVAGIGTTTTGHAIRLAKAAEKAGADALLALTPFSVIPRKEGLYSYYKEISQEVSIPLLAYNLPAHTNVTITPDTVVKLVDDGVIAGIKDSSGNVAALADMVLQVGDRTSVITGGDDILLQALVTGCSGAILALGNLAPGICVDIFNAVRAKDMPRATELYYKVFPLAKTISAAENFPAPVKEGVRQLGRPAGPCRSPIKPVTQAEREEIAKAIKVAGLSG